MIPTHSTPHRISYGGTVAFSLLFFLLLYSQQITRSVSSMLRPHRHSVPSPLTFGQSCHTQNVHIFILMIVCILFVFFSVFCFFAVANHMHEVSVVWVVITTQHYGRHAMDGGTQNAQSSVTEKYFGLAWVDRE